MEIYGDDDDTTDIQDQKEIKVIPLVGYTAQKETRLNKLKNKK